MTLCRDFFLFRFAKHNMHQFDIGLQLSIRHETTNSSWAFKQHPNIFLNCCLHGNIDGMRFSAQSTKINAQSTKINSPAAHPSTMTACTFTIDKTVSNKAKQMSCFRQAHCRCWLVSFTKRNEFCESNQGGELILQPGDHNLSLRHNLIGQLHSNFW